MCVRILGLGSDHVNFLEMLEDAQLFFKEIETCGFSLEQPSISFSKGLKNFQKTGSYIENLSFPINQIEFNTLSKSENFEITKEIIHELYDGLYDNKMDSLLSLMKLDSNSERFDGGVAGDYDTKTQTKIYDEGFIYSFTESYVPVILSHEFTHTFYGNHFSPGQNYNYNEFCSIFADFFAANYMCFKQEDHLNKYQFIRFNHLKECFQEFNNLYEHSQEFLKPNDQLSLHLLPYRYSYYYHYGYIVSIVYSTLLFQEYLDSPKEVLKEFRKVVTHEQKVEELLNKYQISFRNSERTRQFQKILQNVHDKKQI